MKNSLIIPVVAITALLTGCDRAPDLVLTLAVDSRDTAVVESARQILLSRFNEFRPSFLSSITSKIDGSGITFTFYGGAPSDDTIKYLYRTRGKVRAVLSDSTTILFTDRDIEEARLIYSDSRFDIALRLSQEAGERVLRLTTKNIGKSARITLDNAVLLDARIQDALRDSFQLTAPHQDDEQNRALVVVLRSGALPAQVSDGI